MLSQAVETADPLVDMEDRFPLLPAAGCEIAAGLPAGLPAVHASPAPLGFRVAAHPVRTGAHGKTYTTVTVTEDTERSDDGKVYIVPDKVDREKEVD